MHISDNGEADSLFLPRREWVSLGDGWYQTTPVGTGSSNRCGLHSVVDSSMGQLFVCVYEPRTQEGVKACHSENPEFDLSVFVKALKKDSEINHMKFDILLGFKSVTDFFGLTGDVTDKRWTLSKTEGRNVTVLSEIEMDIKSNVFYDILIQVRGGSISVDIDSVPIFTSVRFADTTGGSLNGNLGVMAKVLIALDISCDRFSNILFRVQSLPLRVGSLGQQRGTLIVALNNLAVEEYRYHFETL